MKQRSIQDLLSEHRFFRGLPEAALGHLAGCGRNEVYRSGRFLAREGQPADRFFVVRSGRAAIETHGPGTGGLCIQTVEADGVIGWSWLIAPHRWAFDVRCLAETHVIALDGSCLRRKCEQNPAMGFELVKRFAGILVDRLTATRLQLLDVYGAAPPRALR